MGINISGDTVIRLLLRKFSEQETIFTGNIIGIDDFAFKKGHTYGTFLVYGETHQPIDLLNGCNGTTLRRWLKQNQQVKVVTRDRATAYARVLMEELPDVMQIADQFHLHQNLLKAVKKAMPLPYIVRLIILNLLLIPSTNPLLLDEATEFSTASISFASPFAKDLKEGISLINCFSMKR